MSPARLILVRHAEPVAEARRVVYGRTDFDLSEDGRAHAERIAASLDDKGLDALYCSPQLRAVGTARAIARRTGLEPVEVPELRELDFGELEGLDRAEVVATRPELAGWTADPELAFPGGESVAMVARRAVPAVAGLRRRHAGQAFAVVAHAVPVRAILGDALGMPLAALFRLDQVYGGIAVIDWFGDTPLVRTVNGAL